MQPSLTHYEFVTLFIDRGLTSEKYNADGENTTLICDTAQDNTGI